MIADASWTEITVWTDKQTFDPTREVIRLKFESDKENPFQEIENGGDFSIWMMDMKLHNNSDTPSQLNRQGELGNFRIILNFKSGTVTKTTERFALGNIQTGETEVCKQHNAFRSITDQGRLPKELMVDLLGDPIFTAEGTVSGKCTYQNAPDWTTFVKSEEVKFLNAGFNTNHKAAPMGWKSYWKIVVKTGM